MKAYSRWILPGITLLVFGASLFLMNSALKTAPLQQWHLLDQRAAAPALAANAADSTGNKAATSADNSPSSSLPIPCAGIVPAPTVASAGIAQSVPVLLYHGEGGAAANTPIDRFIDQLCTLKKNGWHTITMAQFEGFMKGTLNLPDKSFLLTFDDGRKDSYYAADPVLKALGWRATMFVITGFSLPDDGAKSSFYLNETELKAMNESGRWDLESHTKEGHRMYQVPASADNLSALVPGHFLSNKFIVNGALETDAQFTNRITNDLTLAKQKLVQTFGKPVIAFAYPFNDFGQDTANFPGSKAILDRVVPGLYHYAFYQTWPQNGDTFNYPDPNAFFVRRIEPDIHWNGANLLAALNQGRAKPLPYDTRTLAVPFGAEWLPSWGTVQTDGTSLSLTAAAPSTGAEALLNGSGAWTDYSLTVSVNWIAGSDVVLIARHHNSDNYLACAFSENRATLEKHIDDVQTNVARGAYAFSDPKNQATFTMNVQGPNASCSVGGMTIASGVAAEPVLQSGNIGIQAWDETPGTARLQITGVRISPL